MIVEYVKGETWARNPLLKCKYNAEYTTPQKCTDALISHLQLKNSLQSSGKCPDTLVFYSESGERAYFGEGVGDVENIFFGDTRFRSRTIPIVMSCQDQVQKITFLAAGRHSRHHLRPPLHGSSLTRHEGKRYTPCLRVLL